MTDPEVWTSGSTTVRCVRSVPTDLLTPFWDIYLTAFGPLRTKAAARQVLWREEFDAEMSDERVWKYLAFDADDHPIGLATLTRDLATVPWISPEFYAARHPEQAARDAIYYVPFACTDTSRARAGVFWLLAQAFVSRVAEDGGVLGYDICLFNNQSMDFAAKMEVWYRRLGAHTVDHLDSQNYYVAEYGQGVQ